MRIIRIGRRDQGAEILLVARGIDQYRIALLRAAIGVEAVDEQLDIGEQPLI